MHGDLYEGANLPRNSSRALSTRGLTHAKSLLSFGWHQKTGQHDLRSTAGSALARSARGQRPVLPTPSRTAWTSVAALVFPARNYAITSFTIQICFKRFQQAGPSRWTIYVIARYKWAKVSQVIPEACKQMQAHSLSMQATKYVPLEGKAFAAEAGPGDLNRLRLLSHHHSSIVFLKSRLSVWKQGTHALRPLFTASLDSSRFQEYLHSHRGARCLWGLTRAVYRCNSQPTIMPVPKLAAAIFTVFCLDTMTGTCYVSMDVLSPIRSQRP